MSQIVPHGGKGETRPHSEGEPPMSFSNLHFSHSLHVIIQLFYSWLSIRGYWVILDMLEESPMESPNGKVEVLDHLDDQVISSIFFMDH